MDNKVTILISQREAAIKAWLKELTETKGAKLPDKTDMLVGVELIQTGMYSEW